MIGQALRLVAIGVAVGLVAAAALTRLLERLLFGVEPLDPWTFAATSVVLLVVATVASYLPARRSMRLLSTRRAADQLVLVEGLRPSKFTDPRRVSRLRELIAVREF